MFGKADVPKNVVASYFFSSLQPSRIWLDKVGVIFHRIKWFKIKREASNQILEGPERYKS